MSLPRSLLVLPFALIVASCGNSVLPPSGFLGKDDAKLAKNKTLPFGRSWKNPEADLSSYSKIAVRPMRTDRLRSLGPGLAAVSERNIDGIRKEDVEEIADYATGRFQHELDASPGREAFLTHSKSKSNLEKSDRSKSVMILETNLVEAVPGKPAAQVANFFVPFTSLLNRPTVGMEGRLIDARSGETLFAFSDLEEPEISLFDRQKFSYYGLHRREAARWAEQLRKVVEGNAASPVKDAFFIQPVSW